MSKRASIIGLFLGSSLLAAGCSPTLVGDWKVTSDVTAAGFAAAYGAGYVCAHTGGRSPRKVPFRPDYDNVVDTVRRHVVALAERAEAAGVPRGGILIDGTGYGKNTADHLLLLRHVREFVKTEWPVLMALSNKTFVGESLAGLATTGLVGLFGENPLVIVGDGFAPIAQGVALVALVAFAWYAYRWTRVEAEKVA